MADHDRQERLTLTEAVSWRAVENQVVGLDLDRSLYFAGNSSAAVLWPELAAGTTRAALVRVLSLTFELDPAQAEQDVDAFLASLDSHGYLRRNASDDA